VDLRCNTCFHGIEEEVRVPYVLQEEPVEARVIWPEGAMRIGRIGEATVRVVDARRMREIVKPLLERDPYFWVKR